MDPDRSSLITRVGLLALAGPAAVVGMWAAFLPRSFYDRFPGGGRSWVAIDGPFNQHLVRDVGQLNLGFTVLLLIAAVTTNRLLRRTALVAYIVPAVLHLVYHASHLSLYGTGDAVGNMASLSLAVVVPLALLALDAAIHRPQAGGVKRT